MRLAVFIILLIPFFCTAQNKDVEFLDSTIINSSSPTYSKLNFIQNPENARIIAKNDIENGTPYVFLIGGICPVVYTADSAFMIKYNVVYHDYGDLSPPIENIENYNFEIFTFLRENYGKKWMREIRKDAIGLKKWKRNCKK